MNTKLGEILVEQEIVSDWQISTALSLQKDKGTNKRIGEILLELKWVKQTQLDEALDVQIKRKHLMFMFDQLPEGY